jgi:phosphatidylserine decarboxylase
VSSLTESLFFLRQFSGRTASVGSLIPTSRAAARAMASEMARRRGPRRILEVGTGTGAITAEIARHMRPDDTLVAYELHPEFADYLRRRLDSDPVFQPVQSQITLVQGDILTLDPAERFDFIISAIPFVNCPADVVERVLALYRTVLRPDGVLSFIEYAYLRALKLRLISDAARAQAEASIAVMQRDVEPFVFRRDHVVANVPPAWVRHLRFTAPEPADALALAPLLHTHRIGFEDPTGIAVPALPIAGALAAAALVLRRRSPALAALAGLGAAGAAAFFRDPLRAVQADPSVAYAAADGSVLSIDRVHDARFGDEEWLRIAVFLALTDVHINRAPVAGKVVEIIPEAGGFANASTPAAEHNNSLYTVIEGAHGRCIVAQRTGILARRIVNWMQPGELVAQGERTGLICFGSRTDVYLPADRWRPAVEVADQVTGGITVLARRSDVAPR